MARGIDLRVTGSDSLARLARDLKRAGDVDLRRELLRAGRRMSAPIKAEVAASARTTLPRRGGLSTAVAAAKVTAATRLSGRDVGVTFSTQWAGHDLEGIDRGLVRHPVYGNRRRWVAQPVRPGYWTRAFEGPGAAIAHELFLAAVDEIADRLAAGG